MALWAHQGFIDVPPEWRIGGACRVSVRGPQHRMDEMGTAMASDQYDFIIIGGGSAGSALANRLSADPANRVLVLEAGRPDYKWDVFIHMPAALTFPIGSKYYDWKYESEPEPFMNGRRVYHATGKVLGGSSSINGMIFQRGNPRDDSRSRDADPAGRSQWDRGHRRRLRLRWPPSDRDSR